LPVAKEIVSMEFASIGPRQPARRETFVRRFEVLEDRLAPSFLVPIIGDTVFMRLPRTGGVAVQSGSLLMVGVATAPRTSPAAVQSGSLLMGRVAQHAAQSGPETLIIQDDGTGNVTVEWNGGPVHAFTGINQIAVAFLTTVTENVSIIVARQVTAPLDVHLNLDGSKNTITENFSGFGVPASDLFSVQYATLHHHETTSVTVTR
jgi:hypothetical protein